MLDPQENLTPEPNAPAPSGAPPLDASAQAAFAPELSAPFNSAQPGTPRVIKVSGPAWAEYHLLLSQPSHNASHDSSRPFTRIEREVRVPGGAPVLALLLARWSLEEARALFSGVELSLALGRDPNARLLRRELEAWVARLPALKLQLTEDEGAPEVPYRILMGPHGEASPQDAGSATSGAAQPVSRREVLQCGAIGGSYRIECGPQVLEAPLAEFVGHEVREAARAWSLLRGESPERAQGLGHAALGCWKEKPVLERIGRDLTWREVEVGADMGAAEAWLKIV